MRRFGFFSLVVLIAILLSSCGLSGSATLPAGMMPGKQVVGYYAQWAAAQRNYFVADIPADRLTVINYAFSNVSPEGKCILGDKLGDVERFYPASQSVSGKADVANSLMGNFHQLAELKAKYPYLKVVISIGGYSWSENFSKAALTDASRKTFVQSCIDLYLRQYKDTFDGIDIDWEYPVTGGLVANGIPDDRHNFTLLMAEFRQELDQLGSKNGGKHYLLTAAFPGGPGMDNRYERSQVVKSLDWINLMTYDLHGPWDPTTNFNAPLYQANDDPGDSSLNVDAVVTDYLDAGVPPEKIMMGVPFYGHSWLGVGYQSDGLYQLSVYGAGPGKFEKGSPIYTEIVSDYLPSYQRFWDNESQVPYLYSVNNAAFISYDDPQSIAAKAGYAKDKNLGGIMVWELSQGNADMLNAIQKGFQVGAIPQPTKDPNAPVVPRPFSAIMQQVSGIKIDGNLDDWKGDPLFTLNDKSQLAYKLSSDSWKGPQDLSGQIWAGWAPEGLYFAVKVVDDVHIQTSADPNLWHGDYVEFQFDTLLEKDRDKKSMNSDDYQIGVSVGDFGSVPPYTYAWFNGPDPAGEMKVQQAQTKTADGYIVEVFFPIDLLKGLTLASGSTLGMNVSLSDADSQSIGQKAMLSTSPTRTYADPTTFGAITLK